MENENQKHTPGDWCWGHEMGGMQQPAGNCVICYPPNPVEWRYPTASKKQPAHAYKIVPGHAEDRRCNAYGLCGRGVWISATKLLSTAGKNRKYPIWKCPQCVRLAGMPGDTRAAIAKAEGR